MRDRHLEVCESCRGFFMSSSIESGVERTPKHTYEPRITAQRGGGKENPTVYIPLLHMLLQTPLERIRAAASSSIETARHRWVLQHSSGQRRQERTSEVRQG